MDNCKISIYLAYIMSCYSIATMYYLVASKSVGTPFYDSLTKEQIAIKKKSRKVRLGIFQKGFIIGITVLFVTKPFQKCK